MTGQSATTFAIEDRNEERTFADLPFSNRAFDELVDGIVASSLC